MISLILPYWNRERAARRALESLARYAGQDVEVVVVDDGSDVPPSIPKLPVETTLVTLPRKYGPKNPCVAFNAGVEAARGDLIALSCVEMIHVKAVLSEMRDEIRARGRNCYVTAACWSDEKKWHAHSSLLPLSEEGVPMPPRAHYHFLSMLSRELWNASGGFDPEYRDGAGYDDPDFLMRVQKAGASFVLRDDLVVIHQRVGGVKAPWTSEMRDRNRELFRKKWRV